MALFQWVTAGAVVICTALTSWLAWAAICPAVWDHGSAISRSFSFHTPEGSGSSVQLHPLTPNAVNRLVPSPYSSFTISWATVWLFPNYCIWNQLLNRAAKNTPSNQIIVMWVDELFLYTVLVANESLNPFRNLKKKGKARISPAMSSSLLVFFFFFQKEEHAHKIIMNMWTYVCMSIQTQRICWHWHPLLGQHV